LIALTDMEGSKIVTFGPNGLAGGLPTGVGAVVHGFVAAAAVETPPASRNGTAQATASAVRASLDPSAFGARARAVLNDMLFLSSVTTETRTTRFLHPTPSTVCSIEFRRQITVSADDHR
jgi:hypothetical protein